MRKILLFKRRKLFFSMILAGMILTSSCSMNRKRTSTGNTFPPESQSLAVLGFKPVMTMIESPGVVRSPFSGAVFMAEPVPQTIADSLTEKLFKRLDRKESYKIIPPKMTMGVLSSFISTNNNLQDIDIYQKVGKALSVDTVMAGYLYRWQEREGSEYSIKRPASVAFDIYLIRTFDKVIIWKAKFDKTQQSLSENILDLKFFLKGKGKWMTASELADLGFDTIFTEQNQADK